MAHRAATERPGRLDPGLSCVASMIWLSWLVVPAFLGPVLGGRSGARMIVCKLCGEPMVLVAEGDQLVHVYELPTRAAPAA